MKIIVMSQQRNMRNCIHILEILVYENVTLSSDVIVFMVFTCTISESLTAGSDICAFPTVRSYRIPFMTACSDEIACLTLPSDVIVSMTNYSGEYAPEIELDCSFIE